jgi:peptidoglycan/LPS O-acetylase OafA/YrhL
VKLPTRIRLLAPLETNSRSENGDTRASAQVHLPPASPELPNLDLLRAIAVLIVLGAHLGARFGIRSGSLAHYGVLIFFLHTSLVLMMSMERSGLRGRKLFLNFYIRRFFRIYPLSIVCVLAVVAFKVPVESFLSFHPFETSTVWSNLGLVMNLTGAPVVLAPLWSLPYEIDMYLVLPLFYLLVSRKQVTGIVYLGSVILAASYWLYKYPPIDFLLYLPCFISGVVAYLGLKRVCPRYSGWYWIACIFGTAAIYMALHRISLSIAVPDQLSRWLVTGALGFVLPLFRQLPAMKWAHLTAKYSYGIYLFHMIAIWCGFTVLASYPLVLRIGVFVAMMFAIPVMMFAILEEPFIQVGKKLVDRLGVKKNSRLKEPEVFPTTATLAQDDDPAIGS